MNQQMNPLDPNVNMLMRQALLATAPRQSVELPSVTATKGGTYQVRLNNLGITTKLRLKISAAVTIGTDALTASDKAPWSLIDSIKLVDFANNERVNISGFHLWLINCIRNRTIAFYNNEALAGVAAYPNVSTAIGAGTVDLYIEVPIAYDDERDLRGAVLAQAGSGEWYLKVTFNN